MSAIDRENLKAPSTHVTHPAGDVRGLPIPWIHNRVSIGCEPCLAGRKLINRAKRKPRCVAWSFLANYRGKDVAHNWHGQENRDDSVEEHSEFQEHPTS